MNVLNKHAYIPSSVTTSSISLSIAPALLLVLSFFATYNVAGAPNPANRNGDDGQHQVCGTVRTEAGETVTLKEGITISLEDFEKVHVEKLQRAVFSPVTERNCAIQLCGFTSWGDIKHEGYIGSTSDYADCDVIQTETTASLPVYNALFNTSSISCGCTKRPEDCTYTCSDRNAKLNQTWADNDCAVLYQESACNNCYLHPVNISKGQNYSTDLSHHIRSVVVRDKCRVQQYIPALKRMWRFVNTPQPIIYNEGPSESNVKSAFQSDAEYFHCECGDPPTTTPPQTPPPSSTTKSPPVIPVPDNSRSLDPVSLGLMVGGIAITLVVTACVLLIWNRRYRNSNVCSICFGDDEDNLSIQKRGSNESNETQFTSVSDENGDMVILGDNQIQSMPFNVIYFTSPDLFTVGELINEGHFGQVYRGTLQVAIKRVKAYSSASEEREISINSLQQEIKILAQLGSHQNVVRLMGYHMGDCRQGEISLIIEWCRHGSLKSYLESTVKPRIDMKISELALTRMMSSMGYDGYPEQKDDAINEEEIVENDLQILDPEMFKQFFLWVHQIASGMQYIQSKNIIHVDLATRNVLLNDDKIAKIGDFGLSKRMYIKNYASARKDSLPIRWVAPESLKDYKCSTKSDVWSFGVTVWEIFNLGKDPYEGLDGVQVMTALFINEERLDRPQFAPEDVYSKLKECWNTEPDERPSFDSLEFYFHMKLQQLEPSNCEEEIRVENEDQGELEIGPETL